jgi:8-oxo-dGTP diphosphatase
MRKISTQAIIKGVDTIGVTVTFFCHDGNGEYVFSKRSVQCRDEHGCWDPGGGSLDFGEDILETLRREIKEEYNSDTLEHQFLGYRDVHRVQNGVPTHWISLDFKVLVDRKKVRNNEPHKFDDLQWFSLDNLPEPMHSQWAPALEKYRKELETKLS